MRARRDQRLDVPAEPRVGKLLEEVGLELCAAHALPLVLEIATETLHHAVGINLRPLVGKPQIEEVASLLALVERAHLGAEELVEGIRPDHRRAAMPARAHRQLPLQAAEHREVFPGVDLDLQFHRQRWGPVARRPIDERHAAFAGSSLRGPEPRIEHGPYRREGRTDRAPLHLHEIQVLRVARRRRQEQLVERGPASEGHRSRRHLVTEQIDHGPRQDQVLLDLKVRNPGRLRPPLGDEVERDHHSCSTSWLMFNFHRCERERTGSSPPASSGTYSLATRAT